MKVVIVKDIEEMPTDCDSCPFQDFSQNCGILGDYTMLNYWVTDAPYYDLKGKGDCPLKSLPEPKERIDGEEFREWECEDHYKNGYVNGWNDCLKEIEK